MDSDHLNEILDDLEYQAELIAVKYFSKFTDQELSMPWEEVEKRAALKEKPVSEKFSANTYETPSNSKMNCVDTKFMIVTPKCDINKPVAVLREPVKGEPVISMNGSPLLVSRCTDQTGPNLNLPLDDGRVYSLRAVGDFRKSMMPDLNETTRRELAVIKNNIDRLLGENK